MLRAKYTKLFQIILIFSSAAFYALNYSTECFGQIKLATTKQVSLGIGGAVPSGASGSPALAVNGQKLVFNSDASNLVDSDNNTARDIFITDVNTAVTSRLSLNSSGVESNGPSFNPAISPIAPDGFFAVAYESDASNLSALNDSNSLRDIYVHLPKFQFTEVVSIATGNVFSNGNSRNASLTLIPAPNKLFIVFESDATNLVDADTNSKTDIFLATVTLPAIPTSLNFFESLKLTKISSGFTGQSDGNAEKPKVSGDGKFVVFTSSATNLLNGSSSAAKQVYLYNISKGTLSLISKDSSGNYGNADSFEASISYNGRYITYLTKASSIDSSAALDKAAVMFYDTVTGITSRINMDSTGVAGNGDASNVSISANGRFVSFSDTSSNLVFDDTNNVADIFVKDLLNNQISRVSRGSSGEEPNAASDLVSLSGNGFTASTAKIAFRSFATNFNSDGTASGSDIFSNDAFLAERVLEKKTRLEVPADITQTGKRANFVFENFLTTAAAAINSRDNNTRAKKPLKVKYDLRVSGIGSKNKVQIKKIAKKNQLALARLKPGNYSSKYRAITTRGEKIVSATKFSPVQKFTVVKN